MEPHRLWDFAKQAVRFCRRWFWYAAKSWAETLSVMAGGFYLYASYRTPPGHLLNWSEFRAVFFDVFNRLMIAIHAGGCGQ
jgi:hypothetical protein